MMTLNAVRGSGSFQIRTSAFAVSMTLSPNIAGHIQGHGNMPKRQGARVLMNETRIAGIKKVLIWFCLIKYPTQFSSLSLS
jgi:hypothetical protein